MVHCCPSAEKPLACIITSSIDCFPLSDRYSQDLMSMKVKLGMGRDSQYVVICSAYFPIEADAPPREVVVLSKYCEDSGLPLLMGCDSNCNHTLWGCKDDNARGRNLVEFLASSGMEVANRGCTPTFSCSRGLSIN